MTGNHLLKDLALEQVQVMTRLPRPPARARLQLLFPPKILKTFLTDGSVGARTPVRLSLPFRTREPSARPAPGVTACRLAPGPIGSSG